MKKERTDEKMISEYNLTAAKRLAEELKIPLKDAIIIRLLSSIDYKLFLIKRDSQ